LKSPGNDGVANEGWDRASAAVNFSRRRGIMKRGYFLPALLILITGFVSLPGQERDMRFIDGHKWESLSNLSKVGYLLGFEEGLKIAETAVLIEKKDAAEGKLESGFLDRMEKWISAYKVGDHFLENQVKIADDVFEEDENKMLMVAAVLPLVSKRVRGEIDDAELKERLEKLREVLK
jgi:hypothetical protein